LARRFDRIIAPSPVAFAKHPEHESNDRFLTCRDLSRKPATRDLWSLVRLSISKDAGELLGLLHDLGKYSKAFQDYLGSAVRLIDQDADDFVDAKQLRGRVDHSTAGAQFIWRKLSQAGPLGPLSGEDAGCCASLRTIPA
jgi:CRISPR-associated endonuclease Cas3-HD